MLKNAQNSFEAVIVQWVVRKIMSGCEKGGYKPQAESVQCISDGQTGKKKKEGRATLCCLPAPTTCHPSLLGACENGHKDKMKRADARGVRSGAAQRRGEESRQNNFLIYSRCRLVHMLLAISHTHLIASSFFIF